MPRHARIVAAGFPLHAILRGIDRSAIFFDDADYRALLGMLVERAAAESVWVHAYVLMTNHLHLLMTPATDRGPSLLMKGLGQGPLCQARCNISTGPTVGPARFLKGAFARLSLRRTAICSPANATSS
jgi:REP element-mobilizing transposase RayT